MARARNVKPGFFKNELLAEMEPMGRLLFIGLWTLADREGRMEDRPRRIKGELFPYDNCEVEQLLNDLAKHGFILRYEADGTKYIQIVNFSKHQNPHVKEAPSTIPAPGEHHASPADSLIPDSPLPIKPVGASAPTKKSVSYSPEFETAWYVYPIRVGDNPKTKAYRAWNARLKEGHTEDEMTQGASRYRAWVDASGKTNTEFVMQACRFFGPDKPFLQTWQVQCGQPARKGERQARTVEDYRENLKSKLGHEQPDAIDSTATRLD